MIGRSIGALLVVGSGLALVACGGKATAGGFGGDPGTGDDGSGSNNPTGGYQTPPPTYDTPPPTYDTPPPTYDNPGGPGAVVCTQLCNSFAGRTCQGQVITAEELAACPAECSTAFFPEGEPCAAEYGTLITCVLRSQFFQDLLDAACAGQEIDEELGAEELVAECGAAAAAFEACGGSIDNPDPGGCTVDTQCIECPNACSECQCLFGAGSETCVPDCGEPL